MSFSGWARPVLLPSLRLTTNWPLSISVAGGVDVRSLGQRRGFVEEGAGEGDDLVATYLVVTLALSAPSSSLMASVPYSGVVQRTPAGVGGVEGEAGVHHRHHQLRAGHAWRSRRRRSGWWPGSPPVPAAGSRFPGGTPCRPRRRAPGPCAPGARRRWWPAAGSRLASRALFFGARSWMTLAAPAQNCSAVTPVPGMASLFTKSYRTLATCRPPT